MSLRDEIFEQPGVIASLVRDQAEHIKQVARAVPPPQRVFIAARGTSDNAARYAKYIWGAGNRIPVALATPSLFSLYSQPPDLSGQLVVGISQSGESPDLIAVLEQAKQQGCQTLTITNHPESPLASLADQVIDLQVGEERSIAATKTYTAELVVIAMLSAAWRGDGGAWADISRIPDQISTVLEQDPQVGQYAPRYRYMDQCVVLGRGYNYSTAHEWSLKLKELNYVGAQPYSSADFLHGPIALVSHGFPVFAVAPRGMVFQDMESLLTKLRLENQAELFLLSNDPGLLKLADCPILLPEELPEWLSPIISVIPAQLFCYHLAIAKGMDPDSPRGLTKVTLTR